MQVLYTKIDKIIEGDVFQEKHVIKGRDFSNEHKCYRRLRESMLGDSFLQSDMHM